MMPTTPTTNPRYLVIRAPSTPKLVAEVDPKLQDGVWECLGAPFFDASRQEWCQAIVRPVCDNTAPVSKAAKNSR
jgi:hypothetical protein